MCEIPHIIQHQCWTSVNFQKPGCGLVCIVLVQFEDDREKFKVLSLFLSLLSPPLSLSNCLSSPHITFRDNRIQLRGCKALWNVTKEAAGPANGFN